MGHIVFGAPGVDRYHLIERLVRELSSRGHRSTVLCFDAAEFAFWAAQGLATVRVAPGAPLPGRLPLAEIAEIDGRRAQGRWSARDQDRRQRRLAALAPGCQRFFELETPDLLVLHQRRTSAHGLLQFIARECGTRTVWTGEGLLPHTIQLDDEGIDADARAGRRSAWDFRGLASDEAFLEAILAGIAGHNTPTALSRRALQVPPPWTRLRAAWQSVIERGDLGLLRAYDAWRQALPPPPRPARRFDLPGGPFVALLLQGTDDARLWLDAAAAPPASLLATAVRTAARAIDRDMPVVALLPGAGLPPREMARLRGLAGIELQYAEATVDACIAATAVVTVNAPIAAAALLANTPVVHLGRALYGVPGVATRGTIDTLTRDLDLALTEDQPELRRRFLTWMFAHGHVWCSPEVPDHNGICGLVLQIERRLVRPSPSHAALQYRPGPPWPLAADHR